MNTTIFESSGREAAPFQTIDDLRKDHTNLLRFHRTNGSNSTFFTNARIFIQRARALGTMLDRPSERIEAQRILDQWGSVLCKANSGKEQELDTTLMEYEGRKLPDEPRPYVGLNPFGDETSWLFFGRDKSRVEALEILRHERLLAVFGVSGSGKSSLIRGGVLPALRKGDLPDSQAWLYLPALVPGDKPLKNLLDALQERFPAPSAISTLKPDDIRAQPQLLAKTVRAELGEQPVVILIDQFEELFTLCREVEIQKSFAEALLAFMDDSSVANRVILTMRSDFEHWLNSIPPLRERLVDKPNEKANKKANILRLTPLTTDELREAIEKPARAVGLRFHPEVVDALLQDVRNEIAALPLLQFTLRRLWETREGDLITLRLYEQLGGAKGALTKRADEFFEKEIFPEEQPIARRILLRMVRIGEGLEVTSGRVLRSSLLKVGFAEQNVESVIDKLVKSCLVRMTGTGENVELEVAHEAMVRNWPRLMNWLEEDRAKLITRRQLDDKALEWKRRGCGKAALLDEVQLTEAERWLENDGKLLGYHPLLPVLVMESRQAVRAKKVWLVASIIILIVLFFAAATFAVFFFNDKQKALNAEQKALKDSQYSREERARAEGARTAAERALVRAEGARTRAEGALARAVAARFVPSDSGFVDWLYRTNKLVPALAAARALEYSGLKMTPEISDALRRELLQPTFTTNITRSLLTFAFSEDGQRLLTVNTLGTISIWNLKSGQMETNFPTGSPPPDACVFSPDASHLLGTWSESTTGILYSVEQRTNIAEVRGLRTIGRQASFLVTGQATPSLSAGGKHVAFIGEDGRAYVQSPFEPTNSIKILSPPGVITRLFLSRDGTDLAAVRRDDSIAIYNSADGKETASITNAPNRLFTLAWSPDGKSLVISHYGGNLGIWHLSDLSRPRSLKMDADPQGVWLHVAFNREGEKVGAIRSDGVARIWELKSTNRPAYVPLRAGFRSSSLAFDPGLTNVAVLREELFNILLQVYPMQEEAEPAAKALQILSSSKQGMSLDEYSVALGDIVPELREAVQLARSNLVQEAILQASLASSNMPWARLDSITVSNEVIKLARNSLETQADRFARAGDTNKAYEIYRKVRLYDPKWDEAGIDARIRHIVAEGLYRQGVLLMDRGNYGEASEVFCKLFAYDPLFDIPVTSLNRLCWNGSLAGLATNVAYSTNLMFICEKAVTVATASTNTLPLSKGSIRDSRGLARALTGDINGAIEDFEAFVREEGASADLEKRRDWINQLRAGRKPDDVFTPEVLQNLRRSSGIRVSIFDDL